MNTNIAAAKDWKAALYARLSRDDGDKLESDSIVNQKDLIRSFIRNKENIELVSEYEDDGWSGVDFERPSFKRLIDDIREAKINCVIVKDLSRLGRNYIETGRLLEQFFPFMGVRFIAINDNYDSKDHNSHTDNLIIPFKNLINDAYCADTSRKIRSQFDVKRKNGEFIGSFSAFGYMKDPNNKNRLIVDENAAPIVQDIFSWKIQGMSQQGIADKLNELGVLSPLEYKKANGSNYTTVFNTKITSTWTPVAVGRILKNDLYIGVLTQGITTTPNYKVKQRIKKDACEWVRIEQSHEAIISSEDFALVTALLKKDTRIAQGKNSVYLFSGMLYCADCGKNLVRKNVPSGKIKYVYHVCRTFKKSRKCTTHNISEKSLYSAVYETISLHIRECVQISGILDYIRDLPLHKRNIKKIQKQINAKTAEIEKLESLYVSLYEDFAGGIITIEDYTVYKIEFAKKIADAKKALDSLMREYETLANSQDGNCLWLEYFKSNQNIESLTRNVIVELIERITVYEGGKIEIRLRYQNYYEETLRYINSLPSGCFDKERAVC